MTANDAESIPAYSLKNTTTFPPLLSLPSRYQFSPMPNPYPTETVYFNSDRPLTRKRHYCFLATIVEVSKILRLILIVKDRDGRQAMVAFYDDRMGKRLGIINLAKANHMIVIVDPLFHEFMDGSIGVRVEEEMIPHVKVNLPGLVFARHLLTSKLKDLSGPFGHALVHGKDGAWHGYSLE